MKLTNHYDRIISRSVPLLEDNGEETGSLILTRRIHESVVIDDKIVITILGIKGNQVKIDFFAPLDIPIYRTEIFNNIQMEKRNIK